MNDSCGVCAIRCPRPGPSGRSTTWHTGWRPPAREVLDNSAAPYDIFAALYDDLCAAPSVLVLDDLHWADQGTIDLLRFVLRRISRTRSLVIGIVRDDEVGANHPMRELLGDVARSPRAGSLRYPRSAWARSSPWSVSARRSGVVARRHRGQCVLRVRDAGSPRR